MIPRLPAPLRTVALTAISGIAIISFLTACAPAVDDAGTPRRIAREVDELLTSIAVNELADDPELATRLGLTEELAGYRFNTYLTDRSQAAYERSRVKRLETLEALLSAPRPAEGGRQAGHLDTVIRAYETAESLFVTGHGQTGLGRAYPYVADHMRGAYIDVPDLLTGAHPFNTAADARDYVARLSQFAGALQDERRRLQADARAGIVPPAMVLERMQALAGQIGAPPAETHVLVTTFDNLVSGADGLAPDEEAELRGRVLDLVQTDILPAYAEFSAALEGLTAEAPEDPGVWQLPGGNTYYDSVLAAYTDEGLSAETLHAQGLAEVEQLTHSLLAALEAEGFTEGTLAERLAALAAVEGTAAAKLAALLTGVGKPGAGAFPDHLPLELCHTAQHLHHHPAGRRCSIDSLGQRPEACSRLVEAVHDGGDLGALFDGQPQAQHFDIHDAPFAILLDHAQAHGLRGFAGALNARLYD